MGERRSAGKTVSSLFRNRENWWVSYSLYINRVIPFRDRGSIDGNALRLPKANLYSPNGGPQLNFQPMASSLGERRPYSSSWNGLGELFNSANIQGGRLPTSYCKSTIKGTLNTTYIVDSSILWVHTFVYHIFIHFNSFHPN
jgi:hypothetical protein